MRYDITFFAYKKNKVCNQIFEALNKKLNSIGIKSQILDMLKSDKDVDSKVTVALGGKKRSRKGRQISRIMELQKSKGDKHIVVDSGYIHERPKFWSVGWDDLNGRADFRNKNSDSQRIDRWGVTLEPWLKNKDGHVLFCLQLPWDAAVINTDYVQYILDTTEKLLKNTNRKIVVREHPLVTEIPLKIEETLNHTITHDIKKPAFNKSKKAIFKKKYKDAIEHITSLQRVSVSTEKELLSDLKTPFCVVSYNSNSTVEATINGIPSFVHDEGSMTWNISSHGFDVENVVFKDRSQWLNDISYSQWYDSEIIDTSAFEHLGVMEYIKKEK